MSRTQKLALTASAFSRCWISKNFSTVVASLLSEQNFSISLRYLKIPGAGIPFAILASFFSM